MTDFETAMNLGAEAAIECMDAETIVYTPLAGSGVGRQALIERIGAQRVGTVGPVPQARVTLRNDAAAGRLAGAVDTGGDTIAWSPKRGGPTKVSRVLSIERQNAGFVVVLIG